MKLETKPGKKTVKRNVIDIKDAYVMYEQHGQEQQQHFRQKQKKHLNFVKLTKKIVPIRHRRHSHAKRTLDQNKKR